jgi:hypothetical protein
VAWTRGDGGLGRRAGVPRPINGGYDCVAACVLGRDSLSVELSKPLYGRKDIEGFRIKLALSDEERDVLAAGLRKVFRDAPVLKIVT